MSHWQSTDPSIWQGRDDRAEAPNALRLFQTIRQGVESDPQATPPKIALLGFACDEGIRRNQGRTGAAAAPDALRRALANLASHTGHDDLIDLGTLIVDDQQLEQAQQALTDKVVACQRQQLRTLVLGGGHETAYAHGMGIYLAHPTRRVGIINFDAHLDLRSHPQATSGTPFKQLADYCQSQQRPFHYLCVGASLAANTQALVEQAHQLGVDIIWDTDCHTSQVEWIIRQLKDFIQRCDVIYLTIDLDVLPAWQMPGVSAPAAYGLPLETLLLLLATLSRHPELHAVDLVEYNPALDPQQVGARVAARIIWQLLHLWVRPPLVSATPLPVECANISTADRR